MSVATLFCLLIGLTINTHTHTYTYTYTQQTTSCRDRNPTKRKRSRITIIFKSFCPPFDHTSFVARSTKKRSVFHRVTVIPTWLSSFFLYLYFTHNLCISFIFFINQSVSQKMSFFSNLIGRSEPASTTPSSSHSAPHRVTSGADRGSVQDFRAIMSRYDTAGSGTLSAEAKERLVADYNAKKGDVYECLKARYKDGRGGALTEYNLSRIEEDLGTQVQATRYIAFVGRATQCLRYLAYTSDFGEAFRPLAHPFVVRGAYGVSWGYVIGDVAYKGYQLKTVYKADRHDLFMGCMERAIFQSFASMIFPMITIHETVRVSKKILLSRPSLHKFAVWGPTACGLGVVPFLPFMFDAPVEYVVENAFKRIWTPKFAHEGAEHDHE